MGSEGPAKVKSSNPGARADVDSIEIALRQMHAGISAEALPDEFLDILADIDRKLDSERVGK